MNGGDISHYSDLQIGMVEYHQKMIDTKV